jgi:high-affinity iron transporter
VLSTFLIALREGLEASLIISILLAYLVRTGKAPLARNIWIGVALATTLSLAFGAALSFTSRELSPAHEELFAGATSLASVAFVTAMVFWMRRTARGMGKELQGKVEGALALGSIALISTAFFAVVREGLETSLFIYANFRTVRSNTAPSLGLIIGLLAAIALGTSIYRKTVKINLGRFFTITGFGLIVVAGGVLSHGIGEFQSRGDLPGGSAFAWSSKNGDGPFWTILDGSMGISPSTTWIQLAVWATYLLTVGSLYRRPIKSIPAPELAAAIQ